VKPRPNLKGCSAKEEEDLFEDGLFFRNHLLFLYFIHRGLIIKTQSFGSTAGLGKAAFQL
jgi:hypothetical protein